MTTLTTIARETVNLPALFAIRMERGLACSKRSDSGERCEVKKAMKSRGGLTHLSSSLAFIFSRSFLLRTTPHYLNAWNRLSGGGPDVGALYPEISSYLL